MGHPTSKGPAAFKVLATVSAIFAIGVIAVSGAMLHQSIRLRDAFFYGNYGYGAGSGYNNADYYGGGGSGRGYYGYGNQAQPGYGGNYFGGYQDVGYDVYRYHRVITISAIALGAGVVQFLISMLLCCINENNAKGLAIGYAAGSLFLFIVFVVCFGLGFQYRVIYPYYFYNFYQTYQYQTGFYQYNPEGQAYCAVLGINLIYLIVSAIVAGVFAKKVSNYDDRVEWHVRPTTASTASPQNM